MSDETPKTPKPIRKLTPKLQKVRNNLDRVLSDYDLSQQEYSALMDDMKKRRKRIEGAGDNMLDNISDE
jgi:septation ring formation regulator EzrA